MLDLSIKLGEIQSNINGLTKRLQTLETQDKVGNFTAGSILFAGSNGSVSQDNANLFWDDANNKLKLNGGNIVGHTVRVLDMTFTETDTSNTMVGYNPELIVSPGASQLTSGKFNNIILTRVDGSGGATAAGAAVGLRADTRYDQTAGTFSGIIYGLDGVVRQDGEGTLVNAYGIRSLGVLTSTGNLTTLINFLAESPSRTGSGTITTAYGIRINRQKLAAGVTTGYGVYQTDSNDINFFAGDVGIGTTPSFPMHVVGTIASTGAGAGLVFQDRTTGDNWQWYASAEYARLYNGTRDVLQTNTTGDLTILKEDGSTNNVVGVLTIQRSTTGTAAAGFGSQLTWNLEASAGSVRSAAAIQGVWTDATDTSRNGEIRMFAFDGNGATTNAREFFRGGSTAANVAGIGFFAGGIAAKQTVTGTITGGTLAQLQAWATSLMAALAAYNFVTDSTT